jgi:hypothetical protein
VPLRLRLVLHPPRLLHGRRVRVRVWVRARVRVIRVRVRAGVGVRVQVRVGLHGALVHGVELVQRGALVAQLRAQPLGLA